LPTRTDFVGRESGGVPKVRDREGHHFYNIEVKGSSETWGQKRGKGYGSSPREWRRVRQKGKGRVTGPGNVAAPKKLAKNHGCDKRGKLRDGHGRRRGFAEEQGEAIRKVWGGDPRT